MESFNLFKVKKKKKKETWQEKWERTKKEDRERHEKLLYKRIKDSRRECKEAYDIYLPIYCYLGFHFGSLSKREIIETRKRIPHYFEYIENEIALGKLLNECKNKKGRLKILEKWHNQRLMVKIRRR